LAETQPNPLLNLVNQAREKVAPDLRAQADQLQKLEQGLQELRHRQQQLQEAFQQYLDALEAVELPVSEPAATPSGGASLEGLLAAVREIITATLPEQVLEVLTSEGEKLGVRAAVFDVRGKAAWGSSARGFGAGLSDKVFRGLVVPLNQENPFRTCYETGGHVDASADMLKRNRNVLDKLRPAGDDIILLLPIRSAGSVSAIFYADTGSRRGDMPVDALKILAEFAGAQLDRLMAFSGGLAAPPAGAPMAEPGEAEPAEAVIQEVSAETVEAEPVEALPATAQTEAATAAPILGETVPVIEETTAPPAPPLSFPPEPPPPAAPAVGFDLSKLSEDEQKAHRDAKRFAKLLVSEIELYNKAKVADGRKNSDLYKRLKLDIERSRQTYEKRFGKTVGKQYDYFHEELVRTLAGSESSLLGSDYPGPSV
jgi:hypothetical protein